LGRATRIAVLIAAHGLLIWSVRKAKQGAVVERVELPVKDLPESLEGFRIAQISDLHVCPNIRSDEVLRIVSQVNELNADMVAVTGDLADGQVAALKKDVAPLAGLKSRHGTFFVTGNHEYYSDLPGWMAEIRLLGMDILNNEHRVLSHDGTPILVAGVTDSREGGRFEGHESDPQKALSNAPECPYRIMLAHQPNSAYGAADLGFNLVLCGHTHGGQYFPYSSLVGLVMPFVEGLYKHNDTHVYTNRGTGYWGPPMRSKNSEITLLTLVRA
jgi:hypothetical protein